MNLYMNKKYMEDVNYILSLDLPWNRLQDKCMMISGATGLIGSFLIDVILEKNNRNNLNCTIIALGRDPQKALDRFSKYREDRHLQFMSYDVNSPLKMEHHDKIDYILHLASNTHPILYASDPIGTITTNIIGLYNMLECAIEHSASRFLFASSNEIYGENRGDVEFFDEEYCGYIDSNTLRAGYPESKRCGEALCQAYKAQKDLDVVIARVTRSYGPTMNMNDTKAVSQFIKKGICNEDIVLKSNGSQFYSYTYVADVVSGLLMTLLEGKSGEAYNIADESGDITLKNLATYIAEISNTKIRYEIPSEIEQSGYSKATKARLDGTKIKQLGWKPQYDIKSGIERTISILKESSSV